MSRILIVEDDLQISRSLCGFETTSVSSVAEAWNEITSKNFDLICLDMELSDGGYLDLYQKLKNQKLDIPIILISALVSKEGDLRKPLGMEEFKVRINHLLNGLGSPITRIKVGALSIDPLHKVATIMGNVITLGRKELDILILLARRAGEIVSRATIMSEVYNHSELYDRTVDSHISHLRKKLKEAAGDAIRISSVYGQGYRLQCR